MRRRPLRLLAAAGIGVSGYIHYQVWREGYRYAPVREMFLANAALAAVVVILLLVGSRWGALTGALLVLGSLVAFALSRTSGLPTLHGTFSESGLEPSGSTFLGVRATLVALVSEGVGLVATVWVMAVGPRR